MLDTYLWGHVERVSPEAPVPVVTLDKKDFRIGGAGNVALNVKAFGAEVSVIGIIGKDEDGDQLERLIKENRINPTYFLRSKKRITTNKTRIISRNQQMMRLDAEMTSDLDKPEEDVLLESVSEYIKNENPDVLIFEDYNKGLLTEG